MVTLEIFEQAGRPRPELLHPFDFVVTCMPVREDPLGVTSELARVAHARRRETSDRDATGAIGALGIFVLPRRVVLRARREHVDLMMFRQLFGDQPALILDAVRQ